MAKLALKVEQLGKNYRIGERQARYKTLRESMTATGAAWLRTARGCLSRDVRQPRKEPNTFWALRNVSFEVKHGDVVGIIGRNGAGKSTLLKILSRITKPTEGTVRIRGRVGSLLEVGTGFHPELTGRENIYMNGSILGMAKSDIERKFDEIVAFAEVEKFLDTPVKRYSSGMQLRLGFSVAAHLEPEVLVVDEVLAVGDASFQRKCLGKMSEVARQDRTILFVSHNHSAVRSLCTRGILLDGGNVVVDSTAAEAIDVYLRMLESKATSDLRSRKDRRGEGIVRFVSLATLNEMEGPTLYVGQPAEFRFGFEGAPGHCSLAFTIYDNMGGAVVHFNSAAKAPQDQWRAEIQSRREVACVLDSLPLMPGRYSINVVLQKDGVLQDHLTAATFFDVEPGIFDNRNYVCSNGYGSVCMSHRWRFDPASRPA
jgi:lipopolysaccharide transport system ATP-binding protein